ncbi:unnamed protein product [Oppiella nova]|uniref:Uncharacterized protein n=1 Tax=Oppiella nova TaxID=334625 RepID=A0A7R9M2J6_9ACAR|nr:unnamed protein product [Oppiella nova]CAG2169616.1 unnamed protein product [Oppiella nova]
MAKCTCGTQISRSDHCDQIWGSHKNCVYEPLQKIYTHLAAGVKVSPETAKKLISKTVGTKVIAENKDTLLKAMTSDEACHEVVRQGLQDAMGSVANKILGIGLLVGCISAAIDGYKIYEFWKQIKDADNLVERCPGKRKEISEQLDDIKPLVAKLDRAYHDLTRSDIAKNDFECAKAAVECYSQIIQTKVGKFLNDINDLHFEVNGKTEKIKVARDVAVAASITSFASTGAAVANAVVLGSFANPILTGATVVLGVVHAALATGCVILSVISSDTLEKLRKEVNEIEEVRALGAWMIRHTTGDAPVQRYLTPGDAQGGRNWTTLYMVWSAGQEQSDHGI